MFTADPNCPAGLVRLTLVEIITWWGEKLTAWFMQLYASDAYHASSMVSSEDH